MTIKESNAEEIQRIWKLQRETILENPEVIPVRKRIDWLKKLKKQILIEEQAIYAALHSDLRKSEAEAFLSEIQLVLNELDLFIRRLPRWSRFQKIGTPWYLWPSQSGIYNEALGQVLIISPWNYPFLLNFSPLIGAIAAGNRVILKPSEYAPASSALIQKIVSSVFSPEQAVVIEGGKETSQALLQHRFDLIFFTGSTRVGKIVMQAAAQHLCPVILEMGGKSPCIVDQEANLKIAARRIAWSKTINAGQTCVAGDYVWVHNSIKDAFLNELKSAWQQLAGEEAHKNPLYPKIIRSEAWNRLQQLKENQSLYWEQASDEASEIMGPVVIDEPSWDSRVMQEEIFGPLLPVFAFSDLNEVISQINQREKPLALYYFGSEQGGKRILDTTRSGGMCINDTIIHLANHRLPFGGVGHSGTGKYHGKESFLAFSHRRAVLQSKTWMDLPFRYPPYKYYQWLKKLLS